MLRHYFLIAIRALRRQRLYTSINIIGLSLGMACCLLIYLFIQDELSYDRFHTNSDQLFRASFQEHYEGQDYNSTVTPFPLAAALKDNIPEIEEAVRICDINDIVKNDRASFTERYHIADPAIFSIFSFPFLAGDPTVALSQPNAVVVTERTALKFFGTTQALGKTLAIKVGDRFEEFTVTGVAKNVPSASSIQFNLVISLANAPKLWSEGKLGSWTNVVGETYVLARPGVTRADLESKIPALTKHILGEKYKPGMYVVPFLPIADIHLNKTFTGGLEPTSDPIYSYILSGMAAAILLIACINFMTLAVARAAARAREVGIRKVSGASRLQLLKQFWGETLCLSLLSLLGAVVLSEFALPLFNSIAGKELSLGFNASLIAFATALVVVVAIIGGSYPGIVLARFQPAQVLKGKLSISRSSRVRQTLVVIQFTLAITLITCTLSMTRQLSFLQNSPIGFTKEQVITLPTNSGTKTSLDLATRLRQELERNGTSGHVSWALNTFGEGWIQCGFRPVPTDYRMFSTNAVDYDFLPTMGIRLVAGRNFAQDHPADTLESVLVNKAFVQAFQMNNPVGQTLPSSLSKNRIIGVVEDFHFASMHEQIEPLVLTLRPNNILKSVNDVMLTAPGMQRILVRMPLDSPTRAIQKLQDAWRKVANDLPFVPVFVEQSLQRQYEADRRLGTMVRYTSTLVLIISSMGLFGLAAVSAIKRTKEIGVRKILGASPASIITMLSKEALWLVAVANVIAWPVAYYTMQRWLSGFAYRAPLSLGVFLGAAIVALATALLTVCYHSIKATGMNPVDTLRYE